MTTINYKDKVLTLDYEAQLDEYQGIPAFSATAHDESGNKYRIRWDYVAPEWYVNEQETPVNNDLSAFADWEHPAEVTEE